MCSGRVGGRRRPAGARGPVGGAGLGNGHTARIAHRSDGYLLEIDQPEQAVDLLHFRVLRDQAHRGATDTERVALLTEALALWRGQPLSGLSGDWVDSERDRWQQEHRTAEHDLVDAQLSLGLSDELVAPLSTRVTQHPLDERVAGQYMLALHRTGRSADALDHYRQLRAHLVEQLGTDPGDALQALHQQILAADPTLNPTFVSAASEPVVIPRQLPAPPAPFVGRHDELDRLDTTVLPRSLTPTSDEGSPPHEALGGAVVLISAVGGAGGIGKTWLTLHWAHRNLHRFPDGQLFVDLHGFSPTDQPTHPADVLSGFLDRRPPHGARSPDHRPGTGATGPDVRSAAR